MASTMQCPKCATAIPTSGLSAGEELQCPGCGKRLKVTRNPIERPLIPSSQEGPIQPEGNDTYSLADGPTPSNTVERRRPSGEPMTAPQSREPVDRGSRHRKSSPDRKTSAAKDERRSLPAQERLLTNVSPKAWLLAGGGGVALIALIIGLIVAFRGGGDTDGGSSVVSSGDKGEGAPNLIQAAPFDKSQFAVVTAPVDLAEFPSESDNHSTLQAADLDAAPIAGTPVANPPLGADEPLWNIVPDTPATPPEPVAEDLNVPIAEPVLAGLDGPYVLGPTKQSASAPGRPAAKTTAEMSYETPLIDLRTGKTARTYRIPPLAPREMRLSPDGNHLITRGWLNGQDRTQEGVLYSWKPDLPKPLAEIRLPGHVTWMEFVGPKQFVLFAADLSAEQRAAVGSADVRGVLQISDVTTGKTVQTIQLTQGEFPAPRLPNQLKRGPDRPEYWFAPDTMPGAVSPTGKFVALPDRTGMTLVSIAEGKDVGHIPIRFHERAFPRGWGIGFSPDGSQLYVVMDRFSPKTALMVWDVSTGRLLSNNEMDNLPFVRPLPGPEPDTMICGASVADAFLGQIVYTLPMVPRRWSGGDRLLATAMTAENQPALVSRPINREEFAASADKARGEIRRRPPVFRADPAAAVVQTPKPPDQWTAPPTAPPAKSGTSRRVLANWPDAMGDEFAVSLSYHYVRVGATGRNELRAQRIELSAAKPVGEPVVLWPWTNPEKLTMRSFNDGAPAPPVLAALTADGALLAVRDPVDARRVDVWDAAGKWVAGLQPDESDPIDWIGWSEQGKLLALAGGTLGAWDVGNGRAFYRLAGSDTSVVDYGPKRRWLAVALDDAIDFFDAESGAGLARCRQEAHEERYQNLSVSPDGKWLLAVRPDAAPPRPGELLATQLAADLWDLSTGARTVVRLGLLPLEHVSWYSPQQVRVVSKTFVDLIDTDFRDVIWHGWIYPTYVPDYIEQKHPYARTTPDGQLWLYSRNGVPDPGLPRDVWRSQQVPDPETENAKWLFAPDSEQFDVDRIRVEIDLGESSRSEKFARRTAADLQRRGFTIAPGRWALRLTQTMENTKEKVTFDRGSSVQIPAGVFTWQLVAPDGAAAWQQTQHLSWNPDASQYFQGVSLEAISDPHYSSVRNIKLDFKGRDPHQAMSEEVLDRAFRFVLLPKELPGRLIKVGNQYLSLPIAEQIAVDDGTSSR